jgi:F-type H+-transporting ATPase subunit epsilon
MVKEFQLDVVSAQEEIFSAPAVKLFLRGEMGDLEIVHGHLQLLTRLVPGPIHILEADNTEEVLYISGGLLEIQPDHVSILADTVERAGQISEEGALKAKENAEKLLAGKTSETDSTKAMEQLAEAIARLRVIELVRAREKRKF